MKLSFFHGAALLAVFFSFASCGADEDTDTTTTDTTTNADTVATSTIVTTPQHMMVATHKVANFEKWKASYDAHDSLRLAHGVHNYVIGRGVTDSNMVLVAVKVDDMEKAKAFAKDASLKQAMQKGGVVGTPKFQFTTMTYQDTGRIETDMRARTTFAVADWDRWQKSFDSGRHVRTNNGLIDRAYGYDPDDNKKVTVVVAVTDSTKASAFWKSDQLKQLRNASGAIGEPERFVFRVVQRY